MKATVITHIYNEEFLLPFWIKHHLRHFDHGVVIDFASTDNSKSIIRNLAPTWDIIESPFPDFDAAKLDELVTTIESEIDGVKIALTTTEFLIGNPRSIGRDPEYIHSIDLVSKDLGQAIQSDVEFHKQFPYGLSEADSKKIRPNELGRALHINPIRYPLGRHFKGYLGDKVILRVANCLVNDEMINRRLQIQNRIPAEDIRLGRGVQHHGGSTITSDDLLQLRQKLSEAAVDYSAELDLFFLISDISTNSEPASTPNQQLLRLSKIRYDLQTEISDLQAEISELNVKNASAEASIEAMEGRLKQAEATLEALVLSLSWKVTLPLRFIYGWIEFVRTRFFK